MMWNSLSKDRWRCRRRTQIYCGHEYTLTNARFALTIEPENEALKKRVRGGAKRCGPTVSRRCRPRLELELATNPFLRAAARAPSRRGSGLSGAPDWQIFARNPRS